MTRQDSLNEKLNLYEAMFERNPRDGLVSVAKTYLYILLDRPQDALKSALEASLSASSKSLRVQLAIALGYYQRNKPGEALIESRYALNIDPASPLCYLVHASVLSALHRADEARLAFLKCCSLATDNTFLADLKLHNRRAICAAQAENPLLMAYSNLKLRAPEMTEEDVRTLTEQHPTDPVLRALLASLERRNGRIREALALLETGLEQYDAFPERLYLLWKIYDEQLGNHQRGEAYAHRLLEVDPLNDRAASLIYNELSEEDLRHVTFLREMENLPDSIFGCILPIRELEALIGTTAEETSAASEGGKAQESAEEAVLQRETSFTLPESGQAQQPAAPPAMPQQAAPQSTPLLQHMTSMLEQAQLIARELTPTPPPMPMAQTIPQVSAEPEVEDVLQAAASEKQAAAEETPGTTTVAAQQPAAEVPSDVAPPVPEVPVTLHSANQLLAESKFEEALQAFLVLSRKD